MGFPFEVCSLYGFAAESVAPFLFLIGTKGSILNITKKEEVEQRVLSALSPIGQKIMFQGA